MLVIGDRRIPEAARNKLNETVRFIPFMTEKIAYSAISGHPDIFFFKDGNYLLVAPNTPEQYKQVLREHKLYFTEGIHCVGGAYPETSRYNAVVTETYLIHNLNYTDPRITEHGHDKQRIHVNQGYTRCNLLPLPGDSFITSDQGIFKTLKKHHLDILYVAPEGILLPGYKNGFIGGCAGRYKHRIYFIGSLQHFPQGKKIEHFLAKRNFDVIELYDGPLFDGGGLLFI